MNESQALLQPRAEEVVSTYQWNRFQDLLDHRGEMGHNILGHCQELEGNYREFLDHLVGESEMPFARRVGSGHYNPLRDFVRRREFGEREWFRGAQAERFFYENLGNEVLDTLVSLLKIDDEGLLLLTKYWPEEFGDMADLERQYIERHNRHRREDHQRRGIPDDWIDDHLKRFPPANHDNPTYLVNSRLRELEEEMGYETLMETMREKIPRFPQEVHDLRVQSLEDTLTILNALYAAAIKYDQEVSGD